jgi:hypothetical protein
MIRKYLNFAVSWFILSAALGLGATSLRADQPVWIVKPVPVTAPCVANDLADCPSLSVARSLRLQSTDSAQLYRLLSGLLDQSSNTENTQETAAVCTQSADVNFPRFDAEERALSNKTDALFGLDGVYVSAVGLKGPSWYAGNFGEGIQRGVETRFRLAGIELLTADEAELAPGKPKLNIYFSNTNPDTGCHYSVFASLSQTVLLTRNLDTKLEVGTWAASSGPSQTHADFTEVDAIFAVIDRFVDDWQQVNTTLITQ